MYDVRALCVCVEYGTVVCCVLRVCLCVFEKLAGWSCCAFCCKLLNVCMCAYLVCVHVCISVLACTAFVHCAFRFAPRCVPAFVCACVCVCTCENGMRCV